MPHSDGDGRAGLVGGQSRALLRGGHRGLVAGNGFSCSGAPAVVLGIVVLFYFTERPEDAAWLPVAERTWLAERLGRERAATEAHEHFSVRRSLTSLRIWRLGVLYFLVVTAMYGVAFWLPQIVRNLSGLGDFAVGLISAVPYLLAAICMVPIAKHSDKTGERRWHIAVPAAAGGVAVIGCALVSSPVPGLALLSCTAIGIWSALGPSWALPMSMLTGPAARGLALINSLGTLALVVRLFGIARAARQLRRRPVVIAGRVIVRGRPLTVPTARMTKPMSSRHWGVPRQRLFASGR